MKRIIKRYYVEQRSCLLSVILLARPCFPLISATCENRIYHNGTHTRRIIMTHENSLANETDEYPRGYSCFQRFCWIYRVLSVRVTFPLSSRRYPRSRIHASLSVSFTPTRKLEGVCSIFPLFGQQFLESVECSNSSGKQLLRSLKKQTSFNNEVFSLSKTRVNLFLDLASRRKPSKLETESLGLYSNVLDLVSLAFSRRTFTKF